MTRGRCQTAAAVLAASLLLAAACGGGEPKGSPAPTSSSTLPTASSSPTTEETGGPPTGWEDKYTADELEAYEAALARWQRFRQLLVPLEKEGKYTREAQTVLEEYRVSPPAGAHALRAVEKNGYRFEVANETLWSVADSVQLSKGTEIDGAVVVISQCTDYSGLRVTKNGQDVSAEVRPKHLETALLIKMTNLGGKWKYIDSTLKDEESCAG